MQQWLPGHKLKNRPYEILQEIGQGGFGITYKAKNLSLDVPVVIKTPNSKLQRDKNYSKYLQSFKKEAKQLAKLGMNPHPHIVRVFDFFAEDNLPCIIMDYVPGESLYDLVQMNGALSEEKALEYIGEIGSALEVCHQQGIIHRDVHPNNILIHADSGKAILIDFGISGSTQTSRSNRSGNQAFAPWEQLISFGKQSSKTPQVDIYTLAASFYYLVTGDTPTPSLARKFNNDDLIEPKQYNSQISDRINQAILKGLEIEPSDRSQSIEAWLKLLQSNKETKIKSISSSNKEWFGIKMIGFPDADHFPSYPSWSALTFLYNYEKLFSFSTAYDDEFEIHIVEKSNYRVLNEKIAIIIQDKKYEESNIFTVVGQDYNLVLFDDLLSLSKVCQSSDMKMVILFDEKLRFENRLAGLNQLRIDQSLTFIRQDNITQILTSDSIVESRKDSVVSQTKKEKRKKNLSLKKIEFETVKIKEVKVLSPGILGFGQKKEIILSREKKQTQYFTEDLGNDIFLDMVKIPEATFLMGSPEHENDREEDESPSRKVFVPSFYMAKFQITQAQWKQVVNFSPVERKLELAPSYFQGDNLPVENVDWYDSIEFCKRLSQATAREYRLPTEEEWEYACRAGSTTPYHFGETITANLANYNGRDTYLNEPKGECRNTTTPVGSFPANAFGLYDMHGNVFEWCLDTYEEYAQGTSIYKNTNEKVLRGGSWFHKPGSCRSAARKKNSPDSILNFVLGFRCVVSKIH